METRCFTRKDLPDFIHSELYEKLSQIPISRHRAISQVNNPRAADEDVLLVVGFEDEKMIGYLGVLPDYLFYQGQRIKAGWLSCFWVDAAWRSMPVAAGLFMQIMEAWEHKILITNFVPSLEALYRKTGLFCPVLTKTGTRGYMRSNLAEILPPKGKRYEMLTPLLSIADALINLPGDIRFWFFRGYKLNKFNVNNLHEIDPPSEVFINEHHNDNWMQRGKKELEWIMKYPWIVEQAEPDYDSSRYYFSSISRRFVVQLVNITNQGGAIKGLALLCIRSNSLTVPYVFADSAAYDVIAKMLVNTMLKMKLNMVTTFHDELEKSIRKLTIPFLFKKVIKKPYFISKRLGFLSELNFQDGDGDCVFY